MATTSITRAESERAAPHAATPAMPELAIAQGSGPALARRLVGDPARYAHLAAGRGKGATQVLDLDPLRQALGGSWTAYGELIHGIALRILLRHLGGAYEYERYGEGYIVQFTHMSESEARERIGRIASGFAEYLFGNGAAQAEPDGHRFSARRKRRKRGFFGGMGDRIVASFSRLMGAVGTMMSAKQRAAETAAAKRPKEGGAQANPTLRGGRMDLSAPAAPLPDFVAPPPGKNATLRGAAPLASPAETAAKAAPVDHWRADRTAPQRRGLFNAAAPASKPPSSMMPAKPAAAGTAQDAALQALTERAAAPTAPAAQEAAVTKPAKPTELAVDKLSFVHRPMWSLRTNMLAVSTCYPAGRLPSGELALGEAVLPRAATLEVIERVDRGALDHVAAVCVPAMASGRGALIALPLHYETLADRDRRAGYLAACHALPAAARKRLIFICRNIDSEPDQAASIGNLQQLKPLATMVIGLIGLRAGSFALWKRAGLAAVGVDIATTPGEERELIDGLRQFAQGAAAQGLRAAACNLGSMSLAAAAANAGFDFIEGGILQHQPQPTDVRAFTLEDLYLQYAVAQRARVSPSRLLDDAPTVTPA